MTIEEQIFFIIGTLMIFYSSIQEYINLNKFSKKDLFKSIEIYNLDLIATRIYGVLHFTEPAKLFLYPYMWTMVTLSIVGTFFIFKDSFLFNILTITLIGFFYMQYNRFVFRIALNMETNEIPYTYENIYKELKKEEWTVHHDNIKLSNFTKETLEMFNLKSNNYGNISFFEYVNLDKEPELSKYKYKDDILFKDKDGNIYDVINKGKKPSIRKVTIGFSNLFSALNKEEDITKKMLLSLIEAVTSSFIFYLSIIGFDFRII